MSIVCGTDFSESSQQALTAAAQLAARMKMPLHLMHAASASSAWSSHAPDAEILQRSNLKLRREAKRLRAIAGEIHIHVLPEPPDEALLELAAKVSAKLIVVAALGHRRVGKWHIGSHAERLAQRSHVPVLVVRAAEPFEAWVKGTRPLRILLGTDPSLSAAAAMRWVGELRNFGPCDVTALHLYWPPAQFDRLGLHGVRNYSEPDPKVTRALTRELTERLSSAFDPASVSIRLEPHMGRIGDRIAMLAEEDRADVIVVGSHERDAVGRLLSGSASHGVLHRARVAVVCVPTEPAPEPTAAAELRSVLVATDFSETGNAAVPLAYSAVTRGGTVHLVHVAREKAASAIEPHDIFPASCSARSRASERDRLGRLIPEDARSRGIVTLVHVLESDDAGQAICQAAERLGATAICLGTHGRSGVSRALLGSIAESVLHKTRRPLLLARAPIP
jgi:nucleotide-binding universal stress UspA family protein